MRKFLLEAEEKPCVLYCQNNQEVRGIERVPNELVDLAKEISGQNVASATWLLLAAYGEVQKGQVELKKELFRFKAECGRTNNELELVGLIMKLQPVQEKNSQRNKWLWFEDKN